MWTQGRKSPVRGNHLGKGRLWASIQFVLRPISGRLATEGVGGRTCGIYYIFIYNKYMYGTCCVLSSILSTLQVLVHLGEVKGYYKNTIKSK